MSESAKPEIVMADTKAMTFDDVIAMFRRLTGRDPTPEGLAEAKKTWEGQCDVKPRC